MMQALDFWVRRGRPDNPTAWLYKVAYRRLLTEFRNSKTRSELLAAQTELNEDAIVAPTDVPLAGEMTDSMLRLLFVTCDESIPVESQLVFTLKSLCGFSIKEIAKHLFTSEANVYKRYGRAKHYFEQHIEFDRQFDRQTNGHSIEELSDQEIAQRIPVVHQILYLIFTEGCHATNGGINGPMIFSPDLAPLIAGLNWYVGRGGAQVSGGIA